MSIPYIATTYHFHIVILITYNKRQDTIAMMIPCLFVLFSAQNFVAAGV